MSATIDTAEVTAGLPPVLVLDHPDTEAAIPKLQNILAQVPKCLACFKPENAWNEAMFHYFPRTLDAIRLSFGMAQALRADVLPERIAEFNVIFETEVATYPTQIQTLVNAPKSALDINMDPVVAHDPTACMTHLKQAIASGQSALVDQEACIANLRAELHREIRHEDEIQINMTKAKHALCAASALEEAAKVAVKQGRAVLELFDDDMVVDMQANERSRV
jgi:hypothetical protein